MSEEPIKKITVTKTMFHDDDCKLIFEHPKNIDKYTDMSADEIRSRFVIFGRILFDCLLDKDRKEFFLERDSETGEWQYFFPKKTSS